MARQKLEKKPRVLSVISKDNTDQTIVVNGQSITRPLRYQVNQEIMDIGFKLNAGIATQQLNQILHELSVNISALWSRIDCGGDSNIDKRKNSAGEYPVLQNEDKVGMGAVKLNTFYTIDSLPPIAGNDGVGEGCVAYLVIGSNKCLIISTQSEWLKATLTAL